MTKSKLPDAQELRALIAKATDEDLSDGGRYFADSCSDLTQCRHGETGEYQRRYDGRLIEWLWNHRAKIADVLEKGEGSILPSDMADILETIEDAAPTWKDQGYPTALAEVRDMAAVGRSLLERISEAKYAGSPIERWNPANDPAEIVFDLLNALTDALAQPSGDAVRLPRLTSGMIRAACKAHYGSDQIDGISLTVGGHDYNFRQGFQRMWKGIRAALASPPVETGEGT